MPATLLVGLQRGDEGKGKLVDLLSSTADVVARGKGGANAGHTLVKGGKKTVLHLIPSGILRPHVVNVIGNGVVVDLGILRQEVRELIELGVLTSTHQLQVSHRAHLVLPHYRVLEDLMERARGSEAIGTTRKAIGQAYMMKAAREGLRLCDITDWKGGGQERVKKNVRFVNALIAGLGGEPADEQAVLNETYEHLVALEIYVQDTVSYLNDQLRAGKRVLVEGAQAMLLSLEHGTYPWVTASDCGPGGLISGTGISPLYVDEIAGVAKAYVTSVGSAVFPTQMTPDVEAAFQRDGVERGSTTGRWRQCGWLDLPALRYACMVSGVQKIALTKLDVASNKGTLPVCVRYERGGRTIDHFPATNDELRAVTPVYEYMDGWDGISSCKDYSALPQAARDYIELIEREVGARVNIVSVGPDREQTIVRPIPPEIEPGRGN